MLSRIFTVGGLTLVSRVTGFARDIVLAAILGAGPIADAFFVALTAAQIFPRDFCRGSFQRRVCAGLCTCPRQGGRRRRKDFRRPHLYAAGAVEIALFALALVFTPDPVRLLAPGFTDDPGRFALPRTHPHQFPYLFWCRW